MTRRPHSVLPLLALMGVLPMASGCCAVAGWFCGPDKSRWVPRSYDTPEAALQTFLEAARRDNATALYESLASEFKRAGGNPIGAEIDGPKMAIAWQRMRDEIPGLHLIGDAKIVRVEEQPFDQRTYLLEAYGRQFEVGLVRQGFYAAAVRGTEGQRLPIEGEVDSITPLVELTGDEFEPVIMVRLRLDDPMLLPEGAQRSDLLGVEVGYEWKVRSLNLAGQEQKPEG